jgi:hypothetical protein
MYEIRFCQYDELNLLQDFLTKFWSKNHVFARSLKLLRWQHLNTEDEIINFVVAYNKNSKEFDAILGFIPTSQYDLNIKNRDIWLAIWKVKEEFASTGIGLQVLLFLNSHYKNSSIGVLGISKDAMKIYKAFSYKTGVLKHFYIKNDSLTDYSIASFNNVNNINYSANTNIDIKQITDKEFLSANISYQYTPYKTKEYYVNRYFNNSFYEYTFNAIVIKNNILGVFITRKIIVDKASCIRIVDWIGDYSKNLYNEFQKLLQKNDAEYIDFLCKVPNEDEISEMGFLEKNANNEIIPNYFEPFLKKNVSIEFAYKAKESNYAFFKADGDQDRPSLM